nr:tyrosine-type recombinase/integrase [Brevibacterium casei]
MKVQVVDDASGRKVRLVDDAGRAVEAVTGYLDYLGARGCSPNTVRGYAYDLLHLWRFLTDAGLGWAELRPRSSMELLTFLRSEPSRSSTQRLSLSVVGATGAPVLSASTINRILTGIGGFYEWAIATEQFDGMNPIERRPDPAWRRVTDRHQPFVGEATRQRAQRRVLKVRQPRRLPRPLSEEQVDALFASLAGLRDRAMLLLMLNGGLRPGEVLSLHLEDVAYGRRRVFVRVRDDHPGGARQKSRSERVVDLFDADTLAAVSDYVMAVRPAEASCRFVFLVGGNGTRRCEPLSYAALARLFARAATRADIREPWVTPHALRHTHATRMWEGGMRELTLQRRLGHASVESTRLYTRVADHEVAADYLRALGSDSGERR